MSFLSKIVSSIFGKKESKSNLNFSAEVEHINPVKITKRRKGVTKISQVKKHLEEQGSITSWEAIKLYGATRLSSIIFKLKKEGMKIESIHVSGLDRNMNKSNYVNYKFSN